MKRLHHNLTFQVLLAIALGAAIGYFSPQTGQAREMLEVAIP